MVSSGGGSGTVLLGGASFYGFELPLQLPIWKKQLGGRWGEGVLPITPHVKGCRRCTVAPGQEQPDSPRCPNRPAWSCRDLSGKQVCGVQGAGDLEPCGQVLSRPPLGEAGTRPREGPGMASPFVPSAPEILFAWLCRKKELKKKEKEKS